MPRLPLLLTTALLFPLSAAAAEPRPNILWLTSEDHGPHVGCYGDSLASTPNMDALAARGLRFQHAWSCAPVCAPARTTIITGMYPPSLGAEHMRSEVRLPAGVRLYPQLLREAGYFCTNNSKEDYNVTKPGVVWDDSSARAHWRARPEGRPFFAIFNSTKSHESQLRKRPHTQRLDPARVRVPAYHPDTPEVRQDWAQYYDQIAAADADAGDRLRELEADGLAEETIVFYYADHGSGMPRSKRWPCDSGLRVPLVVHFPEKWRSLAPREYQPGGVSERLVSFADLAPTVLSIAGVRPPESMQGQAFAGPFQTEPPRYIYGFRGRMDERIDLVRSVTDGRHVYLRNFMPHLSQGQHVGYQFETPTTRIWRATFDAGRATDAQSIYWRVPKAPEELYDLTTDPDEVHNLASLPEHRNTLLRLRAAEREQSDRIRDTGFLPEAEVHRRSGQRAPREALADDSSYPYRRVREAAELASSLDPDATPALRGLLDDEDPAVRYWGALGLRMRGAEAVAAAREPLLAALEDPIPIVRVAAAEALGLHGAPNDLPRVLRALAAGADPTKTSAYVGVAALNTIDALGDRAATILPAVRDLPPKDPNAPARANEYVARLQAWLAR